MKHRFKITLLVLMTATLGSSQLASAKCYAGKSIRGNAVKICFLAKNKANVCIAGKCSRYGYTGTNRARRIGNFLLEKKGGTYLVFSRGRRWVTLR